MIFIKRLASLADSDRPAEREAARLLAGMDAAGFPSSSGHAAELLKIRARARRDARRRTAKGVLLAFSAVALLSIAGHRLTTGAPGASVPTATRVAPAPSIAAVHPASPPDSASGGAASASVPAFPAAAEASGWERLDLGAGVGELELSPEAVAAHFVFRELPHARQIELPGGTARARIARQDPARPVVVRTPHFQVVVVGTRFEVQVAPAFSSVRVFQGKVRVESRAASVLLGAGQSIRSDDDRFLTWEPRRIAARTKPSAPRAPRPAPPVPASAPPQTVSECRSLREVGARLRCLESFARGEGLAAENATYSLALLARDILGRPDQALEWWRRYQARFPDGALAPDAALGTLEVLASSGRHAEALEAAEAFARRFPADSRAFRVALLRGQLLCADAQRRPEGRQLLEPLAASGTSPLAEQARQALAACGGPETPEGPGLR